VQGSSSMAGRLGEGETGGSRWTPGAGAIGDSGRHRTRTRRHNTLGPASRQLGWGLAERRWSSRTDGLGWTRAPVHEGARKALRGGPAPEEAGQRWRGGGLSSGRQPAASVADGSRRRRQHGGAEEQRRRCTGSGVALRQRAWQLRTAPARTEARGRRTVLSGPIFSRTRGDGRAPPHSANEDVMGGDTEADRRIPPATISPI
jgi:hypothetical protein